MDCGDTPFQGRVGLLAVTIGYCCKFDTFVRGVDVVIGGDGGVVVGVVDFAGFAGVTGIVDSGVFIVGLDGVGLVDVGAGGVGVVRFVGV